MKKSIIYSGILLWALFFIVSSCSNDSEEALPRLDIEFEVKDASAYNANDGEIKATITGGTAPYVYLWSNGAKTKDLTGVTAGTYELSVVYGGKGFAKKTVVVGQPSEALNLAFTVIPETYYTARNAEIALSVTGGTPPYTFLWSNESTNQNLRKLKPGTYIITVTDSSTPHNIVTTDTVEVPELEFVCGRDSVIDASNIRYATVSIGNQCWVKTNMRTIHNPENPAELIVDRFCKGTNCNDANGAQYTWEAVMNGAEAPENGEKVQGICPEGWHVPSRSEYNILKNWLSIEGNGGAGTDPVKKMIGAESSSGFNALLTITWGYPVMNGDHAIFWTSDDVVTNKSNGYYKLLSPSYPLMFEGNADKDSGFCLRCVKD